jgi:hypothetical protein
MNHAVLMRRLAQIERLITRGREHIAKQRVRIAQLRRDGYSTARAQNLLALYLKTASVHEQHRMSILRALTS